MHDTNWMKDFERFDREASAQASGNSGTDQALRGCSTRNSKSLKRIARQASWQADVGMQQLPQR
jgi:hypothetical protein